MKIHTVAVYCGSAHGNLPAYGEAAKRLGKELAENKIHLVYGGGKVGLMGCLADGCMNAGGRVTGIIPQFLMDWEVGHEGITTLEVVNDMHERKMRMASLADAFIALPGGWGTMEELMEMLTWNQIGLHEKPIFIFNHEEYFQELIHLFYKMEKQGFLKEGSTQKIQIVNTMEELLAKLLEIKITNSFGDAR